MQGVDDTEVVILELSTTETDLTMLPVASLEWTAVQFVVWSPAHQRQSLPPKRYSSLTPGSRAVVFRGPMPLFNAACWAAFFCRCYSGWA